jgi:PAS domain S-box-containing protein
MPLGNVENKSKPELIVALLTSIAAEHEYSVLLDESSDPIFAFYPDGTYRYVNRAFAKGVGKSLEQIVGKKIWDVFSKDEADKRFAVVKAVFESGEIRDIEVRVPTAGGDRYYLTTVKPIVDSQRRVVSVICISKDMTERNTMQRELEASHAQALAYIEEKSAAENAVRQLNESLEQRVLLRTSDLASANKKLSDSESHLKQLLKEKEALLIEVHHRVKNNLQVISSLLRLEHGRAEGPPTRAVLADMTSRIRAMALLHETLYKNGEFSGVNLAQYIGDVAKYCLAGQGKPRPVELSLTLEPIHVSLQHAIPFGLLTNELISNSLKHGFPNGRLGEIAISLHGLQGSTLCRLQLSDTGVGLPEDFESRREKSLGLNLVQDLASQLGGKLSVEGRANQGVDVKLDFHAAPISDVVRTN